MGESIHIVVQSRESQIREQNAKLKILGWMISSFLFTLLFSLFIKSSSARILIFIVFMGLFMFSNGMKNPKARAYAQTFLGILYAVWGIIFIGVLFFGIDGEAKIFFAILPLVFFYLAYKRINNYTNFFKIIFRRRR